jgi:hypothetical protein
MITTLFALLACTSGTEPVDTGPAAPDCSARSYTVPSTRGELDGVWDTAKGRFVFFGGDQGTPTNCQSQPDWVGEVWAFHPDCDNFEELVTESGPSPRSRSGVALDTTRNRMIIHGGRYRAGDSGDYELHDDLWAFDLETDTWTELQADDGPGVRIMHTMEVSGDTLYFYGGNTSPNGLSYSHQRDLWSLDLVNLVWTQLEVRADAGYRLFHTSTISADGSTIYVYGGGDNGAYVGPFYDDLWSYDVASGSWTELHSGGTGAPDGRIAANLVSDDARGRLLLWAGHDDGSLGNTNQVWAYDLAAGTWSEQEAGDIQTNDPNGYCDFPSDFTDPDLDAPERRYFGAAVVSEDELLVFGGKTDCGQVNDMWGWDLESQIWTERSSATSGEVCQRVFSGECESLCF